MAVPNAVLPLSDYRVRIAEYRDANDFAFFSVAGQIIAERRSLHYAGDPVRPSLVLWACAANGGDTADALPVAAAFDLFDRFIALHRDLGDDSASTVRRWGLGQSLNAGDALYALAFRTLASDVRDPQRRLRAARLVGEAVLEAIERPAGDRQTNGTLSGAALHAGAVVAGASEAIAAAFTEAGRLVGLAAATVEATVAQKFRPPGRRSGRPIRLRSGSSNS